AEEEEEEDAAEADTGGGLFSRLWRVVCQLDGELGSCTLTLAYFWGLFSRLWRVVCQLDGELGSCTLTLAYFWVYLALHGPTTRLLIIGLIVVTQLSYTIQYPHALWLPINNVLDSVRETGMRMVGRGGGRGRPRGGDRKRYKSNGFVRLATWAILVAALFAFAIMLREVLQLDKMNKPDSMPGMPGLVVDLSGRRFVKTNTVHGVEVHIPVSALDKIAHIRDARVGETANNRAPTVLAHSPHGRMPDALPPIPPPGWPAQHPWPGALQAQKAAAVAKAKFAGGGAGGSSVAERAAGELKACAEGGKDPNCVQVHADTLCEEAQVSESRQQWEEVRAKLEIALAIQPNHLCSLYNYGRLLDYVWNDPGMAESMYRRAAASSPKHVPTLRNYGYLLYFVRRDYKNAAKMWERALVEHSRELDVLSGFGSLQYHVYGNVSRAEELFKEALAVSQAHSNTLFTYASLLLLVRNQPKSAEPLYQKLGHLDFANMMETRWKDLGKESRRAGSMIALKRV
ncbi:hypothetical protein T484DRAFT_1799005, partial [Baffinella frigidus]